MILASHLGRPLKDKKKAEEKGMPYDASKYSLRPVYEHLRTLPELQEVSGNISGDAARVQDGTAVGKAEIKNDRVFFVEDSVGPSGGRGCRQTPAGPGCFLRIYACIPKRKRTIPSSQNCWQACRMFM